MLLLQLHSVIALSLAITVTALPVAREGASPVEAKPDATKPQEHLAHSDLPFFVSTYCEAYRDVMHDLMKKVKRNDNFRVPNEWNDLGKNNGCKQYNPDIYKQPKPTDWNRGPKRRNEGLAGPDSHLPASVPNTLTYPKERTESRELHKEGEPYVSVPDNAQSLGIARQKPSIPIVSSKRDSAAPDGTEKKSAQSEVMGSLPGSPSYKKTSHEAKNSIDERHYGPSHEYVNVAHAPA
ncbi:hypothetical protein KEM56_003463 [Ascosphaera pollenicola]|nr:hypothetical protein KEM56_003463 [Ascosphaera pollenicola]